MTHATFLIRTSCSMPCLSQNISRSLLRQVPTDIKGYDRPRVSIVNRAGVYNLSTQDESWNSGQQVSVHAPENELFSRRNLLSASFLITSSVAADQFTKAYALGFKKDLKKRRKIDESLYISLENGLKIYDLEEGRGEEIKAGTRLEVHYDCKYSGIDVVSSRSARLLGGNRIIAEPLDFIAGEPIVTNLAKLDDRGGGGLFAGSSGPKPPPALSTAVYGMRKGGKRSVIVPPELGYGSKGIEEIPPNTSFELLIEVLQVK